MFLYRAVKGDTLLIRGSIMSAFINSECEKYKAEAELRWGEAKAYKEHKEKTKAYSNDKWNELSKEMDGIFAGFAMCMKNGEQPESVEVQKLVKTLQNHISGNYYHCTGEILVGLGRMYTEDRRFKENIDKHACGTADFASRAIEVYCR